jgi:hypothetical protein
VPRNGGTVSDKPNEKPSRCQLLTGAGAAGTDRVAPSIGGALAASAIASSPEGMDVDRILDRKHLRALFSDRAVALTDLAPGMPRDLAARANESVGRGGGMLRTRAEYDTLFDAVAPGAGARKGSR